MEYPIKLLKKIDFWTVCSTVKTEELYPFNPSSGQYLTSPYNINAWLSIQVVQKQDIITKDNYDSVFKH